ncbi:chromosome segregation protein Csm1/Pcs1-domain-containing protein [Phyllosticta capitalensis]
MPPKRAAAATISNLVDDSASEDEFARDSAGMMVTSKAAQEKAAPATKGAKGRPKKNATTEEAPAKTTRSRATARRASGASLVVGKTKVTKAKPGSKRKALAERPQPNGSDTEEVDDFDQPEGPNDPAPAKPKPRGRPPKAKAAEPEPPKKTTRGKRAAAKKEEEPVADSIHVIPETQPEPDPMDVEPSIEEIQETQQPEPVRRQNTRGRAGSKQPQMNSYRPAASASDAERAGSDPGLRRKLGDMTKKLENLDIKYQNLRDVSMRDAESNFHKLKSSADERAKAQDDLIAALKKELATQRAQATESKSLKTQVSRLSTANADLVAEQKALHTELSDAQKKIETLNTKLSAKVAETKAPGSAVKSTKTAMTGSSDAALIQQLKEDLYSDITGLIIRGVKREEDEDVFDCIQTGRNGTLHFHLAIESGGKASSQSYDDAEFAYVPLLDENRDSQLLEILPDYLTEEICFPRNNAAKFYSKIAECLTKRIVDE